MGLSCGFRHLVKKVGRFLRASRNALNAAEIYADIQLRFNINDRIFDSIS